MKLTSSLAISLVALLAVGASPALAAKKKTASAAPPTDSSPVVTPDSTAPPSGFSAPSGTVEVGAPGSTPAAAPTQQQGYTVPIGGAAAQAQPQAAVQPAQPSGPPKPPEPGAIAAAEQCLRTDADTAARAEQSTKLGVDLLLQDLCGPEVDAASLYLRNVAALARFNPMSERGRAGLSTARVDSETGQIAAPPNVDVSTAVEAAERAPQVIAPRLRKYAADLILAAKVQIAAQGKKSR